jgi:hypothetical protein
MTRTIGFILTVAAVVALAPERVQAQPSRQMPGTRPFLPGSPPINPTPLNPRTTPAASQVGVQSTDFYGKRGYPKVLGDSVETQSTGGASAASAGVSGSGGVSGVQSSGSGGFQGNTGNQIGQNGGGTVLGGLFGGFRDGNAGANGFNGAGQPNSGSLTGGAFTGMAPKGFGFGGTPDFSHFWASPLHGASGK